MGPYGSPKQSAFIGSDPAEPSRNRLRANPGDYFLDSVMRPKLGSPTRRRAFLDLDSYLIPGLFRTVEITSRWSGRKGSNEFNSEVPNPISSLSAQGRDGSMGQNR
jgi:hypothetical protein